MFRRIPGITPTQPPPNHPPLSPLPAADLSPSIEDLVTPNNSPPSSNPTTPVIVTNPNFLPPPPLLPRYSPYQPRPLLPPKPAIGSKLPQPSCRWDNTTNTPSYQKTDQEFWSTRQLPIPVRSTICSSLSVLGFTPDSRHCEDIEDTEVFDIQEEIAAGRHV